MGAYIDHCQLLSTSFDFSCQKVKFIMDAFGEEFSGVVEVDPAADFLAREHDQLAGLEAEILPEVESHPVQQGFGESLETNQAEPEPVHQVTPNYSLPREEPEKILKRREDQKLRLEQKDEEEERKKQEMKEQASKELEEWYSQHKETIEKTRMSNRESAMNAEKELACQSAEVESGQEWERIAKLCDFNPKASRNNKDVSRMRSIILQLKQSPPVCANGQ